MRYHPRFGSTPLRAIPVFDPRGMSHSAPFPDRRRDAFREMRTHPDSRKDPMHCNDNFRLPRERDDAGVRRVIGHPQ
jgi:hypothetical protein